MESDEDDHEAISKQVIDYYKKYSQNKELHKYFSGTPLSYMPQIVKDDERQEIFAEEPHISPASSVTSNRKLEWDNGADIGYTNSAKLQKSVSLPTLGGEIPHGNPLKPAKATSQVVTILIHSPDKSSSSSSAMERSALPSSSSSEPSLKRPLSSSSSSSGATLAFLKRKIGTPNAESTPNVAINYVDTPVGPRKKIKKKVVDLCMTKPITVECIDDQVRKGFNKRIQTSPNDHVSKGVQTGNSLEIVVDEIEQSQQVPLNNQSVIIIDYGSKSSSRKTCSSSYQTDSDLVASSFVYCDKNCTEVLENHKKTEAEIVKPSSDSHSSKETPILGHLISQRQSTSLVGDLDKSINLLQRLLRSKKYDDVTKRRYIKKIVKKIVDNKYNDDSSVSSELFQPKKPLQKSKFTVKTCSEEFLPAAQVSSSSDKSWKSDKTVSEQLLEQRQKGSAIPHQGQGDQLLNFASKERQHQITWIKNEISHLTKLKGLLEHDPPTKNTTTVYMVNGTPLASTSSGRNYVIQTELTDTSSAPSRSSGGTYRLSDGEGVRNYHVTGEDKDAGFVGDIEVTSDDKSTNIKVKASRGEPDFTCFKPKAPSLVGPGKYDTKGRKEPSLEENRALLSEKVAELVKKFTESSVFSKKPCPCCKCVESKGSGPLASGDRTRQLPLREKPTDSPKQDPEVQMKSVGPSAPVKVDKEVHSQQCACCICKNLQQKTEGVQCDCLTADSKLQTTPLSKDEAKVQTDRSCTCDKAAQVCVCTEDHSIQSQSPTSKSKCTEFSSTSTSTISSASVHSCLCCKRKNVTEQQLVALKRKLSEQAKPLCRPCYKQYKLTSVPLSAFGTEGHVCKCYSLVQTKTLNAIKRTIDELTELEDEFCSCSKRDKNSSICRYCKCKLSKTSKSRQGMAYMITFENESFKEQEANENRHLEEIKIKVPVIYKKRHKEKENNKKKKGRQRSASSSASEPDIRQKERLRGGGSSEPETQRTLQDYLMANRPNFVEIAEERRKTLTDSRAHREEVADEHKLLFWEQYCREKGERNGRRLFSSKEMKEINRRNYQRLPEVQKQKENEKKRRLREANRAMADTYNRVLQKLKDNVLKGKRSLPTEVYVLDL